MTKKLTSPTKQKIILLLAGGIILGLSRSPKNYFSLLEKLTRAWQNINRQQLQRAIREFHHDRLIDYREQDDGTIQIVLSEKGKRIALQLKIEAINIPKPNKWDGQWRLVLYDVPNTKRAGRHALHSKLKELGLREWQESVFVYPYPCEDEINFITEFFELRPYVRYAIMKKPTNEAELKLHFGLV